MRKLRALVAALLWTVLCAVPKSAAAEIDAALQALDRGDDEAAGRALGEEVARVSILHALAERGEARRAAANRAASLAEPGSWMAAAAGSLAAEAGGDLAAATTAAQRAVELEPNDARLWRWLAELRRRQDDAAGSRAALERATAIAPDYPAALVELGDVLRAEGQFTPAFNAYNHAVSPDGGPVAAWIGRATARLYFGDQDGALQDLEAAVTASPPGADRGRALMGIVYLQAYLRRLPAGLDRAEEAAHMWADLGRADGVAGAMNGAARVLLETGDPVSAEAWYGRGWQSVDGSAMPATEKVIWQVRSLHGQSRCAAARRDIARANSLAEQAQRLMASDPSNSEHYAWISPYLDAYIAMNDRRAEDAVPLLLSSDTTRPYIRLMLGEAYARLRDRANARLWYERALAAAVDLDAESAIVRPQAAAWLERNR